MVTEWGQHSLVDAGAGDVKRFKKLMLSMAQNPIVWCMQAGVAAYCVCDAVRRCKA